MAKQHQRLKPSDGEDDATKGIHILQRFPDVADEAARAGIDLDADDMISAVRQTGGDDPGTYITTGVVGSGLDKWFGPLGQPLFDKLVFNLDGEIVFDDNGDPITLL